MCCLLVAIREVHVEQGGITVVHGKRSSFIPVSEPSSRTWFSSKIHDALDKFAAPRKPE